MEQAENDGCERLQSTAGQAWMGLGRVVALYYRSSTSFQIP
jgi:hypothetical protein